MKTDDLADRLRAIVALEVAKVRDELEPRIKLLELEVVRLKKQRRQLAEVVERNLPTHPDGGTNAKVRLLLKKIQNETVF